MTQFTKEVVLVAVREGSYTNYVFKDNESNEYIFCTKLPNWQIPSIDMGDIGYLQYQQVKAGESYYDPAKETEIAYRYSNCYLVNFVRKSEVVKNKEIIL